MNENISLTEEIYPIFILLTRGKSIISGPISKITKSPFTHCSISLDPKLRYFYSFNFLDKFNRGFVKETRQSLTKNTNSTNISVFFVNKVIYKNINRNLKFFSDNKDKTKYSFKRLFEAAFNKGKEKNPYEQVCSSFVYSILKNAGVQLAPDNIKCVKPSDIAKTVINNNKYIYEIFDGPILDLNTDDITLKIEKLKNSSKSRLYNQDKIVLEESIHPETVDRSNYDNFTLYGLFHIYTTNFSLRNDPKFLENMKWVKERIEEICKMAGWIAFPYELTLCDTFDDLNVFYNYEAPIWVTGFTYGDKVYMKAPNIYPGTLYYNVVLHECIHVQIYLNEKVKGKFISREDEEGMAVFFSTPLDVWLRELNHGPNWYYYESSIRVQDDFMRGGMEYVKEKRFI
jgi:hypothetical protein